MLIVPGPYELGPKMSNSNSFSQASILSSFDRDTRHEYLICVWRSNSFTLKLRLIREKELDFGNFGQAKQAECE